MTTKPALQKIFEEPFRLKSKINTIMKLQNTHTHTH